MLYFDLLCGASGDMILASLVDLGVPLPYLRECFAKLAIPGLRIDQVRRRRAGRSCVQLEITWSEDRQREVRKAARPEPATDRYRLMVSDVADATAHVEPESVDWIITDPPYARKYLGLYDRLAHLADHALKPGGSLVVMVGQRTLEDEAAVAVPPQQLGARLMST